jgi:G3E family GTPase
MTNGRPLPVTVLTGFLGAGKTTLLNRLLKHPDLADTAVLINEFGEIGLDHLLVERLDGDTVLLNAGCLCCTVRGDLLRTLEGLAARIEAGQPCRRIVIETTGLADPAPILQTLMADPFTARRFRLDGVVTLMDAANGAATLDAQPEAVRQAAVADRLVLTKTDIAGAEATGALVARLGALNPGAPLRCASSRRVRSNRHSCCMPGPMTPPRDPPRCRAGSMRRPGRGMSTTTTTTTGMGMAMGTGTTTTRTVMTPASRPSA